MSKIIMVNSPETEPELITQTFYQSKDGYLYSHDDEGLRLARYHNCTHRWCDECRKPTEKFYTHCPECREKCAIERYLKREINAWPDETPAYSEVAEEYFYSYELLRAMEAFNDALDSYGKPLSWEPGKYRVEIKHGDLL